MKSDLYTKIVLTVIATSLSVIAIQQSVNTANAQGQPFYPPPPFTFTQSGMLRVSVCNTRASNDGQVYCVDVVNGGQLRTSPQ